MTTLTTGQLKLNENKDGKQLPPFQRLNEIKSGETISAIVYGGSKSGKTWFFGTAGDRTLIVDTGESSETLTSPLFRKLVNTNPIIVKIRENFTGRGWVEEAQAFDMVSDVIDYALTNFPNDFDTVIVDEATALQEFSMNKALELNAATGKSKSLERSKEWDSKVLTKQDFGAQMDMVYKFAAGYRDILAASGKHFLLGAHEKLQKKPLLVDGKVIGDYIAKISPSFTGSQYPDAILALFDDIWRMEKIGSDSNITHRLRLIGYGHGNENVSGNTELVAGTRHAGVFIDKNGNPESLITQPNFPKMVAQIRASSVVKPNTK